MPRKMKIAEKAANRSSKPRRDKASKPVESSTGNGIAAILKELWNSAVKLRGSIEPADYKHER